jgi:hypothetical protein
MSDDPNGPTHDFAPVFIAATIAEARRGEEVLDAHGVDYLIRVEPFGRTLFGSLRQGAFFYVPRAQAASCRALLVAAGLGVGVLDADEPSP